jgi:glycosyltransferase involved in cell wall biosynthesis
MYSLEEITTNQEGMCSAVINARPRQRYRAPIRASKVFKMMYTLQNARALTANARELTRKAQPLVEREIVFILNRTDRSFRAYAHVSRQRHAALLIIGDIRGDNASSCSTASFVYTDIPNSKIILTGYVSNHDRPSYYSVTNVLVHPSLRDGLLNALFEAIALGRKSSPHRLAGCWMS